MTTTTEESTEQLIEAAKAVLRNHGYLTFGMWQREDISNQMVDDAEGREDDDIESQQEGEKLVRLSEDEDFISQVVSRIEDGFDASVGINWEVIRDATESAIEEWEE